MTAPVAVDVTVRREGTLGSCGELVLPLVAKMSAELYENGWGPPSGTPGYFADEVISASVDGRVVGFISSRIEDKTGSLWVMGGYVLPEYRRLGIYRRLWEELVKFGNEKGCTRIEGTTHMGNSPMRGFYRSVGRKETWVIGVCNLKQNSDSRA